MLRLRREEGKAVRVWEELCVLVLGGILQAEVAKGMSSFDLSLVVEVL